MQGILDDMIIRLNACRSVERSCYNHVEREKDQSYACETFFPAPEVKPQFSLHCRSSSLLYRRKRLAICLYRDCCIYISGGGRGGHALFICALAKDCM
jgi:hypothetical protein